MSVSFKPIRPLLQTGTSATSRGLSYVGLGVGVLLLLCSIQIFINISQLLSGNMVRKDGYDYVSVTKTVTNENMDDKEKTNFVQRDIDELKNKPFIDGAAPLIANEFHLKLSAAGVFNFETDLFVEAIDNNFLDTLPPSFHWQPGQDVVPIILSSDFFEAFNVFGPGYGLPQFSPESALAVQVNIKCEGTNGKQQTFKGRIVAFTDRINSALVPVDFLQWANTNFEGKAADHFTRVYVKTKDANNPAFLNFLDAKNYKVNKDKTKFGRTKQILQGIFTGLGVFGLLVVVLALMLFSFYLQLVIARSKESLQLLLLLGYSPAWLSKKVSAKFIPVYVVIVLIALGVAELMQLAFHKIVLVNRPELSSIAHWSVIATALLLILLSVVTNYSLVKKLLYKLG